MPTRLRALILILGCALTACATNRPAGPRAPLPHAAAAVAVTVGRSLVDLVEVVAWRAPKLLLYELPDWLITEAPDQVAFLFASTPARVEALIEDLRSDDDETKLESVARLRGLTGLPIEDADAWRAWWANASNRAESHWRSDFADASLAALDDTDFLVRLQADVHLRALSGVDVGYDPKGPANERAEGMRRWHAWRATLDGPGGDDR